ncbi:hypothetical protein V4D30_02620 [Thermodesulfovibrio sp. 3907-1M]|uniref:Phage-Barnase-EndoU-ColicinE5/D-RelE like nuclease 2 domain-containing protein n=1 Tax=Thermodesulfovibrio autotrophicus TaxID=3118333 RepID=A0AAU8GYM6_9BACT
MILNDLFDRKIRLTDERQRHFEEDHPEMRNQMEKIKETLINPDIIVRSKIDSQVELFYKHYPITSVTEKYLCIIVKVLKDITAYFTDAIKRGEILWEKKY